LGEETEKRNSETTSKVVLKGDVVSKQNGKSIVIILLKIGAGIGIAVVDFLLMLALSFYIIQTYAASDVALTFLILPVIMGFTFLTLFVLRCLMGRNGG